MDNNGALGPMIYSYTRQQAIDDGVLMDVSIMAREAGFKIPVAVTISVWSRYIEWTANDDEKQIIQDTEGRLWDVLFMLHRAIKSFGTATKCVSYELFVVPRDGKSYKPRAIELKSVIGEGDDREPVITIMLPEEN